MYKISSGSNHFVPHCKKTSFSNPVGITELEFFVKNIKPVNIYCQLIAAVFSTAVFYLIKSPSDMEKERREEGVL